MLDFGAPPPLVGGVPDPRVTWVARNAEPVIVTRADGLGQEAARRLRSVLQREAGRAGRDLHVRVLAGEVASEEEVGDGTGEVGR